MSPSPCQTELIYQASAILKFIDIADVRDTDLTHVWCAFNPADSIVLPPGQDSPIG